MAIPTVLMILTGVTIGIHGTDGIVGTGGIVGTPGMILSGVLMPDSTMIHSLDGVTHGRSRLGLETDGAGVTHGTDTTCMIHGIAHTMPVVFMIHGLEDLVRLIMVAGAGETPTTAATIMDSTTGTIADCITTIEI